MNMFIVAVFSSKDFYNSHFGMEWKQHKLRGHKKKLYDFGSVMNLRWVKSAGSKIYIEQTDEFSRL